MKGKAKVIAELDRLVAGELGARDQYFQQSLTLAHWGYHRLAERLAHEVEDEARHAGALIRRILLLEGSPTVLPAPLDVGSDVLSMLQKDLAAEYGVAANLRAAIAVCEAEGDYVSRDLLKGLLDDTEQDHSHWLEQQLALIDRMGLGNYLQSQAG